MNKIIKKIYNIIVKKIEYSVKKVYLMNNKTIEFLEKKREFYRTDNMIIDVMMYIIATFIISIIQQIFHVIILSLILLFYISTKNKKQLWKTIKYYKYIIILFLVSYAGSTIHGLAKLLLGSTFLLLTIAFLHVLVTNLPLRTDKTLFFLIKASNLVFENSIKKTNQIYSDFLFFTTKEMPR